MLEICACDVPLDPFALSHRALKIHNCNSEPPFEPCSTRIPDPSFLLEPRTAAFSSFYGTAPQTPPELIQVKDREMICSDHFARSFSEFTLLQPRGPVPPALDPDSDTSPECHWFCDVPSTLLHREPKIYMADALNPTLETPLPNCCMCQTPLTYPFASSLRHEICYDCLANGRLPFRTTTLDFFEVREPEPGVGWTLEETNQLIKLVEDTGDNWVEISQAMRTRTPAECLIHFMRISMYDQYYIADPLAVPPGEIPEDGKMLPFMIAPDPISAFVVFVHELDTRLGAAIAEASERRIKEILSSKSGMMLFDKVPDIIRELLVLLGERAALLAHDDGVNLVGAMREVLHLLESEVTYKIRTLEGHFRDTQVHPQAQEQEEPVE